MGELSTVQLHQLPSTFGMLPDKMGMMVMKRDGLIDDDEDEVEGHDDMNLANLFDEVSLSY